MSAIFYQKYWDVIGNAIINTVLNVLNSNASVAPLSERIPAYKSLQCVLQNYFQCPSE